MKLNDLTENLTATILAVLVHVALLGILLLSYDWSSSGAPSRSKVEPVKAIIVDESQVAEEPGGT
jgi:membrane protein involved in colicin uptake